MTVILVVDDDPVIRLMLREALALDGHSVLEAADGDACSRHLETSRPDLIITDIFMPEKDGIETICEVHDRWPDTKIIAMSTGGSRPEAMDYLKIAKGLGADQVLHKPFSVKEILETVNDLLATGRRVGQTATL